MLLALMDLISTMIMELSFVMFRLALDYTRTLIDFTQLCICEMGNQQP